MHSTPQQSRLEEAVEKGLAWARRVDPPELKGELVVAASPTGEPAARILCVGVLHSGGVCRLAHPSEASLSLLPYREYEFTLVAFTGDPKDSRIVHLAEAASLLGARGLYVVGPPMHPGYEERLSMLGASRVEAPREAPVLSMSIASLVWTPRLLGMREGRFRGEIEALSGSTAWLRERFAGEIEEARGSSSVEAYSTPLGLPGALYLYLSGQSRAVHPLEMLPLHRTPPTPIVFMASVEEPSYRDVIRSSTVRGVRPVVFNINTDPITVGFYSILIAAEISEALI
ncbi:hypothetical protein apy_09080 [Aeropyrum pernix]|uniref:Uncharacterized protein n=1 Tax=Aeropyrum pernix TaxID=56636 RepID=A0A401H9V3_AERPX|nr:hypothetical protein [Aeropyrum pernix]GBF09183.1 hypothetical protein apy_09080 [Aeropyrum pernix]